MPSDQILLSPYFTLRVFILIIGCSLNMIFLSSFLDILSDSKGQGKSSFSYSKGGGKQNSRGGEGVCVLVVGGLDVWMEGPGC